MYQLNESELDNILVAQKDLILRKINVGCLIDARAQLDVVRHQWFLCNYGYKWNELVKRIQVEERKREDECEA